MNPRIIATLAQSTITILSVIRGSPTGRAIRTMIDIKLISLRIPHEDKECQYDIDSYTNVWCIIGKRMTTEYRLIGPCIVWSVTRGFVRSFVDRSVLYLTDRGHRLHESNWSEEKLRVSRDINLKKHFCDTPCVHAAFPTSEPFRKRKKT